MKKLIVSVVSLCLFVTALSAWKCSPQESVPLAQAGYQVQVYAHASAKTANAFHTYRHDKFGNTDYANLLAQIDRASELGERLFQRIDDTPVLTPENKWALLDEVDKWALLLDGIIADGLFKGLPQELRNSILVFRSVAAAVKLAVASIQTAQAAKDVPVKLDKVNADAQRATRGIGQTDADLIQRLGQIVAETAAEVLAAKGMPVEHIRASRTAKREALHAYILSERARLGQ